MTGDNKAKAQREAEKYVIQGKIPQAIAEYQKIIKVDPEDLLTLNTIGDLCLRMGKPQEASSYFSQVADRYARDNFLLKAIAVYKKILGCDPRNLAVHKTLASLYAKQGLNVEARNEYLRVAEISTAEGKPADTQLAYEKVAELDPSNIAAQMKLAEISLKDGAKDKAHFYVAATARAQAKAGNYSGALDSFKRALELKPDDAKGMMGLLDAAMHTGNVADALSLLKGPAEAGSLPIEVFEMMAEAHLANNDPVKASQTLQQVLAQDKSRYARFLELQEKLLERKEYDAAALCLDPVIPILIEKRSTKQAIEAFHSILAELPDHLPSLTRLADLYSAANDQSHFISVLDRIADHYLSQGLHREALACIEKILQVTPESQKHLPLHRQTFEIVYPGIPYTSPGSVGSTPAQEASVVQGHGTAGPVEAGAAGANPALIEADLLLNYGIKDRALELLRTAEAKDPSDVGVRLRLLALYKENNQLSLAAEECLCLAQAHRKLGNDEAARKYIAEADQLDPSLVTRRPELLALADRETGTADSAVPLTAGLGVDSPPVSEVDFSEDLSEIFFKEQGEAPASVEAAAPAERDDMAEQFVPATVPPRPQSSLADQLQEVDFYIRLGFYDEARAKLVELEKDYPGNPEVCLRQRQISEGPDQAAAAAAGSAAGSAAIEVVSEEPPPAELPPGEDFKLIEEPPQDLGFDLISTEEEAQPAVEPRPVALQKEQPAAAAPTAREPVEPEHKGMFADLLEEVNSLTDQEIAHEEYENHFSLGIAYREMSLTNEAIKEFQEAMKSLSPAKQSTEKIQCCGMLSTCFLEKGMPRSAIRWCETGLAIPGISQHESMALSYDMGVAHAALGETEKALEYFTSLQQADPAYRDVAHKIEELRGNSGQHAT